MRRCISRAPAARTMRHDLARGGAAHDRVVDRARPACPRSTLAHRVQLDLHAEGADRLLGLDEGAAHVVVADQPPLEGQAALLRVAERRAHAAVGHRHHDVGVGAGASRASCLPERQPRGRARCARRPGCRVARSRRARRRTGCGGSGGKRLEGAQPVARRRRTSSPGSTSRTYSASIRSRAQVSEQTIVARRRAGRSPAAGSPTGRGPPPGVSGVRNSSEKAPITFGEAGGDGVLETLAVAASVQVEDHLGVRGGLEDRAGGLELLPQQPGVDEVAVVAQGDGPRWQSIRIGWALAGDGVAGGRVAHVAHGPIARQLAERLVGEDVVDEAHALFEPQLRRRRWRRSRPTPGRGAAARRGRGR